jgi:predicted nucleic acid-binding protein
VTASAPDLIYLEAASALAGYVRNGDVDADEATAALRDVLEIPLEAHPDRLLAPQALALAITRRISAYDAAYLALALGANATLVTADRRLAAQAEQSALLPDDGPPS